jgi:hypothetical protein
MEDHLITLLLRTQGKKETIITAVEAECDQGVTCSFISIVRLALLEGTMHCNVMQAVCRVYEPSGVYHHHKRLVTQPCYLLPQTTVNKCTVLFYKHLHCVIIQCEITMDNDCVDV